MRLVLLLALLLVIPASAQEPDEFVLIPKAEVREIIQELNRLRGEIRKANDYMLGCRA